MFKNLLCIGQVYPEPSSSAAGVRLLQLFDLFINDGYKITFATTSSKSIYSYPLENLGIDIVSIKLNDSSFDNFIEKLNPSLVLFDRFISEEQFGWRVEKYSPNSLRILDTEDLHFLRKARQNTINRYKIFSKDFLNSDIAKRELASILRSDLSLIISESEMEILINLGIDSSLLFYLPFVFETKNLTQKNASISFDERKNFVFIGSFLHPPNLDTVLHLKNVIWPKIYSKFKNSELHIYGSYITSEHMLLSDKSVNFIVKGRADNSIDVLSLYRVLLAPISFGAGLKGKIFDAMLGGTPCVMSSMASEGINGQFKINGFVENNSIEFVEKAIQLYLDKKLWINSQKNGFNILKNRFSKKIFDAKFLKYLKFLSENLISHRLNNTVGLILNHHTLKSTMYLSKWIEEKNRSE